MFRSTAVPATRRAWQPLASSWASSREGPTYRHPGGGMTRKQRPLFACGDPRAPTVRAVAVATAQAGVGTHPSLIFATIDQRFGERCRASRETPVHCGQAETDQRIRNGSGRAAPRAARSQQDCGHRLKSRPQRLVAPCRQNAEIQELPRQSKTRQPRRPETAGRKASAHGRRRAMTTAA